MRKLIGLVSLLSLALMAAPPVAAAPNHTVSEHVGAAAAEAGKGFLAGARKVAVVLTVAGRTTIDGIAFVILKGEQGIIYVAEESIYACKDVAKYIVKGARFIYVKTAQGLRWVAVEALQAGEIVFEAVVDVAVLVIEDVEFVLIQLEQGVTFVARKALEAGRVIVKGVKLVLRDTVDGLVWLAESSWGAIKAGAAWTREKALIGDIRTILQANFLAGCGAGAGDIRFFRNLAADEKNSPALRRLARAAHDANVAFTATYCSDSY